MENRKRIGLKLTVVLMALVIVVLTILLLLKGCGAGESVVCSGCGRTDAHSEITTGNVRISLVEHTLANGRLEPFEAETAEVMPGESLSRIVTVLNHDKESFIRARVELIVCDANGNELDVAEGVVLLDTDESKWLRKDDGWFYHYAAVGTEEETEELFTTVTFDAEAMDNAYQNCSIEMNVYAQAVQAAGNGEDVLTAAGWPQE